MPGLPRPGVGGIASLISCSGGLPVPGVRRVSPRLLGFRLDGVGGFTKAGEASEAASLPFAFGKGKLAVDRPRPGLREVLTARFLRLRPFLGGGSF